MAGFVVAASVAALLNFVSSPVSADTIDVPVGDAYVKGHEGDVIEVGSAEVPEALHGRSCDVEAVVTNQSSVHTGNVLVVSSGDTSATITGIEDTAGSVTTQGGTLTLGSTITVAVQLGESGISSIGSSLSVTCEALPTTTPPAPVVTDPTYTG